MKNFLKVGVLALVLVLVSGCGAKEKVLTCTMTNEETGMKSDQTMKVSFKDNKASKVNMTMKMTLDDEYASYLSSVKSMMDSEFEEFTSKTGVKYDSKTDKNTININLELDVTKVSESDLKDMNFDNSLGTYDEVKKSLEGSGYTCK